MWGSLALWNQDHKWYVSVGSLIGLLATVFLCCQTAMLNKHLLWDKVINAETGWLQPVSATSSTTPPPPGPPPTSHHPAASPPCSAPVPEIDMYRAMPRAFQGVSGEWLLILPKSYESVLRNCRQSPFSGRLYLVFLKWKWTELLNFCQLELFPLLLNHLKTTCFPLVFPHPPPPSHWSFYFLMFKQLHCATQNKIVP